MGKLDKIDTLNSEDLKTLEQLLQIPLFDSNSHVSNPLRLLEYIGAQDGNEYGVLVRLQNCSGILKKMAALLSTFLQLRKSSKILRQRGNIIVGRFAVYPYIDDPVTVFQLGAPAELYVNRFVLPVFPNGMNGIFRRLIMKLVKFHPSVAGLIIVARKA